MGREWENRAEEIEKSGEDRERTAQETEKSETAGEHGGRTANASGEGREGMAKAGEEAGGRQAVQGPEESRRNEVWSGRTPSVRETNKEQALGMSEAYESGRRRRGKRKGNRRLTGSMAARIIAFFTMGICSFLVIVSLLACIYMGVEGYYVSSLSGVLKEELGSKMNHVYYEVRGYLERGDVKAAKEICENKNLDLELYYYDDEQNRRIIWSTWDGYYDTQITTDIPYTFDRRVNGIEIGGHALKPGDVYWFRAYMDPAFPKEDEFQGQARLVTLGYEFRYMIIGLTAGWALLCVISFVFLLCAAGHRNGREGIVPGVLTNIYLDVLTAVWGGALFFLAAVAVRLMQEVYYHGVAAIAVAAVGAAAAVLATFYFMDLALRFKQGKWWRHSLIYVVLRMFWRGGRFVCRGAIALMERIPMVLTALMIFLGTVIIEFLAIAFTMVRSGAILLWLAEKGILLIAVMYLAVTCKKLLKASRALAEGQESYRVDTSKMFGDFKEHGENLNSLGQGISRAVAERMKSEHLKTELITNVSHDIKTPLTSIINYANLIYEETMTNEPEGQCRNQEGAAVQEPRGNRSSGGTAVEEPGGNRSSGGALVQEPGENRNSEGASVPEEPFSGRDARIREYAEVLLRQSRRLKKLLEDLVEASKATTGNLEVDLKPCEVGVLLSQAVGEYQQRMEEKELGLIVRQPDQPVTIVADGRHLWRVFDNLLNNICKYAQERSRVYLSVEENGDYVLIIFRNMSKYPLDISGEELEERFVRGDRSRHMEGNGLGLSIAKSLVELQDGNMEIVIDGDLFKVILRFGVRKPM